MNEKSGNLPYEELSCIDGHGQPLLTNAWELARVRSKEWIHGQQPTPMGPGIFPLGPSVPESIKTLEVRYRFKAGHEAEIQAVEEGAPVYRIVAPEGMLFIPVGAVRQWVLRLPAGTSVHAYIDKWQWDVDKLKNRPMPGYEEGRVWAKKRIAELRAEHGDGWLAVWRRTELGPDGRLRSHE